MPNNNLERDWIFRCASNPVPQAERSPATKIKRLFTLGIIAKGARLPAVLVTAYRPEPAKWSSDFMRRMS